MAGPKPPKRRDLLGQPPPEESRPATSRQLPKPDLTPELKRGMRDVLTQMVNSLNAYPASRRNAPLAKLSFHVTASPEVVRALSDFVNTSI